MQYLRKSSGHKLLSTVSSNAVRSQHITGPPMEDRGALETPPCETATPCQPDALSRYRSLLSKPPDIDCLWDAYLAVKRQNDLHSQLLRTDFRKAMVQIHTSTVNEKAAMLRTLLDDMQKNGLRRGVFDWNVYMRACLRENLYRPACDAYADMVDGGVKPNERTFITLMRMAAERNNGADAEAWFAKLTASELRVGPRPYMELIKAYINEGSEKKIAEVFQQMRDAGIVAKSAAISIMCTECIGKKMLPPFQILLRELFTIDPPLARESFDRCMKICADKEDEDLLNRVASLPETLGTNDDAAWFHAAQMKNRMLQGDFDGMKGELINATALGFRPSTEDFNFLLNACNMHDKVSAVEGILNLMGMMDVPWNEGTYAALIRGRARLGNVEAVEEILTIVEGPLPFTVAQPALSLYKDIGDEGRWRNCYNRVVGEKLSVDYKEVQALIALHQRRGNHFLLWVKELISGGSLDASKATRVHLTKQVQLAQQDQDIDGLRWILRQSRKLNQRLNVPGVTELALKHMDQDLIEHCIYIAAHHEDFPPLEFVNLVQKSSQVTLSDDALKHIKLASVRLASKRVLVPAVISYKRSLPPTERLSTRTRDVVVSALIVADLEGAVRYLTVFGPESIGTAEILHTALRNVASRAQNERPQTLESLLTLLLDWNRLPPTRITNTSLRWLEKRGGLNPRLALRTLAVMEEAEKVDKGFEPNVGTYLILLRVFSDGKHKNLERKLWDRMSKARLKMRVDRTLHTTEIHAILSGMEPNKVQKAAARLIQAEKSAGSLSMTTYLALVKAYLEQNNIDGARKTLEKLQQRGGQDTVDIWNAILNHCLKKDLHTPLNDTQQRMKRLKIPLNALSYSILITAACRQGHRRRAYRLHYEMVQVNMEASEQHMDTLLEARANDTDIDAMTKLYLAALDGEKKIERATLNAVAAAYVRDGDKESVNAVLSEMMRRKLGPDATTYELLCEAYGVAGDVENMTASLAKCLLARPVGPFTLSFLNRVLEAHANVGDGRGAEHWFHAIPAAGLVPDARSYRFVTQAFAKEGNMVKVQEYWTTAVDVTPPAVDSSTLCKIIECFLMGNHIEHARTAPITLKNAQPLLTVDVYNTFLAHWASRSLTQVSDLTHAMHTNNVLPNGTTWLHLMSALCHSHRYVEAWRVWTAVQARLAKTPVPRADMITAPELAPHWSVYEDTSRAELTRVYGGLALLALERCEAMGRVEDAWEVWRELMRRSELGEDCAAADGDSPYATEEHLAALVTCLESHNHDAFGLVFERSDKHVTVTEGVDAHATHPVAGCKGGDGYARPRPGCLTFTKLAQMGARRRNGQACVDIMDTVIEENGEWMHRRMKRKYPKIYEEIDRAVQAWYEVLDDEDGC
ncbi:uncharacterized protein EV422DRAFT_565660 [Fimicolochytrium jonesii]|uniref:uncharacterized protein n=1 Tax=Fimicolochytrium jonesii TaxID=1396493 RepID=UPI0022FDEC46|nr:uncharacterized protein EV422DRAFT_565660 [Fimicolochytrium jonesii]KAI8823743.1 hypothetical protein EV422DRAFT_565660 [Fimicolochytrium jonesii]